MDRQKREKMGGIILSLASLSTWSVFENVSPNDTLAHERYKLANTHLAERSRIDEMNVKAPCRFSPSTSAANTAFSPSSNALAASAAPRNRRSATTALHTRHALTSSRNFARSRPLCAMTSNRAKSVARCASARFSSATKPVRARQLIASRLCSTRAVVTANSRTPACRCSLAFSIPAAAMAPARASDRHAPSRRDSARWRARKRVPSMRAAPVTSMRDLYALARRVPHTAASSRSRCPREQRWRAARRAGWRRDLAAAPTTAPRQRSHALWREARPADASNTRTALAAPS